MSDFAKNQLLKFGWSEGKGLGKNENGITQAIKPELKFNKTGIGHKEQDDQWWNSVYNKAANNIVLDKNSEKVSIRVKDKNAVNISSKIDTVPKKSSLTHGNFLKTSTLMNGHLVKDSTCQTPEVNEGTHINPFSTIIDDDELFKACGGRTAHKGARHGLTLNGKLARVAEQERQMNAGCKSCKKSLQGQEKGKKRKKKLAEEDNIPILDVEEDDEFVLPVPPPIYLNDDYQPSKKQVKNNKRKVLDLVNQLNKTCITQDDSVKEDEEGDIRMEPKKKKVKKAAKSILKSISCDTADPTHFCEKCDEFYDYHQKAFDKYHEKLLTQKKKYKKKVSFAGDKETEDFGMTAKEYKRKGKKKLGLKATDEEAVKLNGRISKRKNKKIQKKEKKKKRNLILPAKLQIDETTVKFTNIKIGE